MVNIVKAAAANERGTALIMALLLSVIIAALILAGGKLMETASRETQIQKNVLTEADNVARAGLVDAISWFRRQSTQPVATGLPLRSGAYADQAFYPRESTLDTIDEDIGLVKEYRMSDTSNKWARYEVVRQQDTQSNAVDEHAVHDITDQRMSGYSAGEGLVWYIESIGYVFQKNDATKAFNVLPNRVIAKVRASTEIHRLGFSLPGEAAFMTFDGGSSTALVKIYPNGKITGGANIGAGRKQGKKPQIYTGGVITGNPFQAPNLREPTIESILGMSKSELKLVADYVVQDTSMLPEDIPDMALIYVAGNAVFSSTRPLTGSGMLFVDGNLTISQGSNSVYSGFVYVLGSSTILDPALISGSFVGYTGLTLSRSGATDVAELRYDATILNTIKQQICQYRENKSTLHVFIGVPGLEN